MAGSKKDKAARLSIPTIPARRSKIKGQGDVKEIGECKESQPEEGQIAKGQL